MKNIFKLVIVLLISLQASCQVTSILPYKTLSYEAPNGAYLKDLDNEFPFWLDTWEGIANNKKYTFTFLIFPQYLTTYPNGEYQYEDKVVGKLKVINLANNQIIYDETSFTQYDEFIIHGNVIVGSEFDFGLYDKESHCNNAADFTLVKDATNPDQIFYKDFKYDEYWYWDCPNYQNQTDIPMFLPKVNLTLIRQ